VAGVKARLVIVTLTGAADALPGVSSTRNVVSSAIRRIMRWSVRRTWAD